MKRAVSVALLAFAGLALAQQDVRRSPGKELQPQKQDSEAVPRPMDQNGLIARQPTPKTPTALLLMPQDATGRLIVKFNDQVKARPTVDGRVRSMTNQSLDEVQAVIDQFGVQLSPLIRHEESKLTELEARAASYSGKAQPDLAGMMYVDGPPEKLQSAARALNDMPTVEWVEFEVKKTVYRGLTGACCVASLGQCIDALTALECTEFGGVFQGTGTLCDDVDCMFTGACCVGGDCTDAITESTCLAASGFWAGPNSTCDATDCDIDCGGLLTGNCYTAGGNGNAYCDDQTCCELICSVFDPFCCDEDNGGIWDEFCAAEANLHCAEPPGGGADHCSSPLNGNCFVPHFTGGCNNEDCCNIVRALNPNCADFWGPGCVTLAIEFCTSLPDPAGTTPDYSPIQGYLTPEAYDPANIPPDMQPFIPLIGGVPFVGFGGEGWNLGNSMSPAGDDPANPDYPGLYGLGQRLIEVDGHDAFGQGNLTLGKTMKIAIIEWGYYPNHEDLGHVILEPGQTLLSDPVIIVPDHGTATLSIANARDEDDDGNPRTGVIGIAPQAQGYFFPLTSLEDGPREFEAWTSAMMTLGPGDVISASYGPGPRIGNLNNSQANWTMIRMASDLGITCCIAAGNDCFNLDGAPDLGDSGGMVVGACSPGFPWYRLAFSNYCTSPDLARSNIVHVKAWGSLVTSAGYGLLFNGVPPFDRSYTPLFGGTSAAAPQIAGLVADLQGLAKQFYGIPLMPEQIRAALGAPGNPPPDPPRLFGTFPEGQNCNLDLIPGGTPNMIGPYPDVAGNFGSAASSILNQNFGGFVDSPLIDEIAIVRGNLVTGNVFSIKGSDNSYLVIESEFTSPGDTPGPGLGAGHPTYFAFGEITDLQISAHSDLPGATAMAVSVESHVSSGLGLMFIELFDWAQNRWTFAGFDILDTDDPDDGGIPLFPVFADRFVSGDRVLIRVWTLSLGGFAQPGFGQPTNTYRVFHDWINLTVGEDFGDIFSPGSP